jgi:hypothetical protein
MDKRRLQMTLYFPDSDTGYYEDEYTFFAHDRELELAAQNREDRLEAQAEEMHAELWAGPIVPYVDDSPIYGTFGATDDIDPETGCTAAEMKEEEVRCPVEREIRRGQLREGRVA